MTQASPDAEMDHGHELGNSYRSALAQHFTWACLLCSIPVLMSTYPPMVDVPQHAAQVATLKSMWLEWNGTFAKLFEVKPFTPYWLGYLVVMALSLLLGITWAVKVTVAIALALFSWSAARFCNRAGGNPAWNWMLLLLPFGFAYQWGFLNFLVAAPFGFLFLSSLLDLKGRSDWRACVRIALWLHFLFFAHVLVTAFFCMIGMALVAVPWAGVRDWLRRCLPIFTILPIAGIWLWASVDNSPAAGQVLWRLGAQRLVEFLPSLISSPSTYTGQLLGFFFLAVPFLSGARPKHWLAWSPFGLYVMWMLFVPHDPGGVAFAYERFGFFGLPLYLASFEMPPEKSSAPEIKTLNAGLVVIAFAALGWQGIRALTFNSETAGFRAVIQHADPGKRMLTLSFDPTSHASSAPLMLHFGSWYQAEHRGIADFSFASNWMQPLQYRTGVIPGVSQGFEWNPSSFDWQLNRGNEYDYFLVRHPADASHWLAEISGGSTRLLARSGMWQLYSRTTSPPQHPSVRPNTK